MQHPHKSKAQKRKAKLRYNRRRAQKNAERQNKVREEILRDHASAIKARGRKGVKENVKTLTFWGRLFRFFR